MGQEMSRKNESYVPLLCGYPDSEKINKVSEGAEAMFCRLIAKCDDDGNYHGEPMRLLGKLFTLRYENGTMNVNKVKKYLKELIGIGLVVRYECVTGCNESVTVRYVHVIDCKKSLRVDVKKKVFFPEYKKELQTLANKEDSSTRNECVTGCNESVTPNQPNPNQTNPNQSMSIFDEARNIYLGTKKGLQTEYNNFTKKHKDWQEVLLLLKPAIKEQIKWREDANGEFRPVWKNFQTWINKRCWEDILSKVKDKDNGQQPTPKNRSSFGDQKSSYGVTIEV